MKSENKNRPKAKTQSEISSINEISKIIHDNDDNNDYEEYDDDSSDIGNEDEVEDDDTLNFKKLGLSAESIKAISEKGFEIPTQIQAETIPLLLKGKKNIVAQSKTGTGKTAAFGLPILEKIPHNSKNIQALILAPTRELAIQVAEEIDSLKGDRKISIATVYGGQSIRDQIKRLRRGVDIVVGTPGRVIDFLEREELDFSHITHLVLDEADEMLNMGFWEQVEEIIKVSNPKRKMLLFSATMPDRVLRTIKEYMGDYHLVRTKSKEMTVELTEQYFVDVRPDDKVEALSRIIDIEEAFYGIVFCHTRADADDLGTNLINRGYNADILHGDISQSQREVILKKFRNKIINILVATDVAARGIDVNDLTHVINYSVPKNADIYVHRIGRTGRAGKQGVAITFVTSKEFSKLSGIKRFSKANIQKKKIPSPKDIVNVKKLKIIKDVRALYSEMSEINNDLENKKQNIVVEKAELNTLNDFQKMAHKILKDEENSHLMIAALLKYSFKDLLDTTKYSEIEEFTYNKRSSVPASTSTSHSRSSSRSNYSSDSNDRERGRGRGSDRDGNSSSKDHVRLFVALGKKDNITKSKLVSTIKENTDVTANCFYAIEVFDNYSFVTVSPKEAKIILDFYKKNNKGRRPLIEQASEKRPR
ncbi:MAG: DEAD/DEAH box helicase [Oligoflexia bacterium]|nr:DEAD/DEAH box helicase [Oligoflexia bacterium]